jgi:2,3-bisphosphoglycerate-independent phosphoglycerate mutase
LTNPILYVILDGVGDKPFAQRENKTPLEAASTPNLDKLAERGKMGIVYTVKRGVAPESDAGVFSLLSYDPSRISLSRGVVEAIGSGIDFRNGDLALRCNFATAKDGKIVDRRAGRRVTTDEARELAEAISQDSKLRALASFAFKATVGHRCALVFRSNGAKFSDSVTNLDPAYARKGKVTIARSGVKLPVPIPKCRSLKRTKTAQRTARLLNEFAAGVYAVLDNHPVNVRRRERGDLPANFLLMRDAGTRVSKVRTLQEKFGFRAVALADMPVELGIAKVIGMDIEVFRPDRSIEGYSQRVKKAVELANSHDLVYVHLKGPDEPGHDGDFDGKRKSIEDIDAGFFGGLQDLTSKIVCVTADHSTPCTAKGHTDDPVPLLVVGPGVESDGSKRFTESYAMKGKLGKIMHGYSILSILKKYQS